MRAFVIRPFGQKRGVDFERVHSQLIAPALQQVGIDGGTTGDIVEAGNIREDMLRELYLADIVVADVSVQDANVFYELGVRHAVRNRSTVMIRARIDDIPLDVTTDRYLSYDPDSAAASVPQLVQVLRETLADERVDSPVFRLLRGDRGNTVPDFSSRGIFVSYRREDTAPYARLLQYELSDRFPNARVFLDLDSIGIGRDFGEVISEAVHSCAVLVALIGRQWVTLTDEGGQRRIDDPDDLVRFEVGTALQRGLQVIPVLVDGAKPLRPQQLPAELDKLARLNALELSYNRYHYDANRLLDHIKQVLAAGRDRVTN